jgi:hypothetical protein
MHERCPPSWPSGWRRRLLGLGPWVSTLLASLPSHIDGSTEVRAAASASIASCPSKRARVPRARVLERACVSTCVRSSARARVRYLGARVCAHDNARGVHARASLASTESPLMGLPLGRAHQRSIAIRRAIGRSARSRLACKRKKKRRCHPSVFLGRVTSAPGPGRTDSEAPASAPARPGPAALAPSRAWLGLRSALSWPAPRLPRPGARW